MMVCGSLRGSLPVRSSRKSAPQTIAFQPANAHRVISPLTAAQMRQMLQGVVLHGTGTQGACSKATVPPERQVRPRKSIRRREPIRIPSTWRRSRDLRRSTIPQSRSRSFWIRHVGLHQGGQIAAPVFQRIAQHVLEYLHVPHDVELPANRQVWLAKNKVKDSDLDEASPDHLGGDLEIADAGPADNAPPPPRLKPSAVARSPSPGCAA